MHNMHALLGLECINGITSTKLEIGKHAVVNEVYTCILGCSHNSGGTLINNDPGRMGLYGH